MEIKISHKYDKSVKNYLKIAKKKKYEIENKYLNSLMIKTRFVLKNICIVEEKMQTFTLFWPQY